MNMDMDINTLRGRLVNSSANSSRELLAHSSVSSIPCIERMEAQSNNPSWANQVEELNKLQRFTLFYANLKVGEINITNKAIGSKNTLNSIFEKSTS